MHLHPYKTPKKPAAHLEKHICVLGNDVVSHFRLPPIRSRNKDRCSPAELELLQCLSSQYNPGHRIANTWRRQFLH